MCYNVLCDKYATRLMYGYCPNWVLKWEYRRKSILEEIRHYSADIISLQVLLSRLAFLHGVKITLRLLFYFIFFRKWRRNSSTASFCRS